MSLPLLSKIGMVLSFIASFMLSPDLLGTDRLQKVEMLIQGRSLRVKASFDERLKNFRKLIISLFFLVLLVLFLKQRLAEHGAKIQRKQQTVDPILTTIQNFIKSKINSLLFTSMSVYIVLHMYLNWKYLSLSTSALTYIAQRVEGEGRLRASLIWWGIRFHIFGNMLMFVAEFAPSSQPISSNIPTQIPLQSKSIGECSYVN